MESDKYAVKEALRRPLSEVIRPTSLKNVIGQKHLLNSNNGAITNFITLGYLPSMILYGPPGVGKTTLAKLLAEETNYVFVELSATDATVSELRDLLQALAKENLMRQRLGQDRLRVAVFIDEIHRFTVVQQDFLLPFVESGAFVFLAATTVSPSKRIRRAILSRCQLFELRNLTDEELRLVVEKAIVFENIRRRVLFNLQPIQFEDGASEVIAKYAHGDSRTAINFVELLGSSHRSMEDSFLSKGQVEESARNSTKVRLGLQNGLSIRLMKQLYDFMNQRDPGVAEKTQSHPQLIRHSQTQDQFVVTINVRAAQAMAVDLESCLNEDPTDAFTDDESDQKGPIYLDDDDEPYLTNRVSRTKYFVRAAAHTMLQLVLKGELLQVIIKYLLLYACTYIKVQSLLLPQVMAVHKSLQKATIDVSVALTNCIEQLTIAPKQHGERLSDTLSDLKAFFGKAARSACKPMEPTFKVEEDEAMVEELLKEPATEKMDVSDKTAEIVYDFEEAFYTLGNEGTSLLETSSP